MKTVTGKLTHIEHHRTKEGDAWATVRVADTMVELFPRTYTSCCALLEFGKQVEVTYDKQRGRLAARVNVAQTVRAVSQ